MGPLGAILGLWRPCGPILGELEAYFGAFWANCESSEAYFGPFGPILRRLEAYSGAFWANSGGLEVYFGAFWANCGKGLEAYFWSLFGQFWAQWEVEVEIQRARFQVLGTFWTYVLQVPYSPV